MFASGGRYRLEEMVGKISAGKDKARRFIENPREVSTEEAIMLSERYNVPLHPNALFYYRALDKDGILKMIELLNRGKWKEGKLILARDSGVKELLEKIGVEHKCTNAELIVGKSNALALKRTLQLGQSVDVKKIIAESNDVIDALCRISGLTIKDKCGTFIGSRMGRPEASKPRSMKGNPNVLFPIGLYGGNTRSINKAMENPTKDGLLPKLRDTYF